MSAGLRIWGACRALTVRSIPPARRAQRPFYALPRARWYSDDTNKQESRSIDQSANTKAFEDGLVIENINAQSSGSTIAETAADGAQSEAVEPNSEESNVDTLDDATLEQLFYGGGASRSEGAGGLTAAQEQALYQQGSVPSPAEAELILHNAERDAVAASSAGNLEELKDPGHKFGLPKKPYPEGFNLKKRYHPVLEQLTRLLMRDGKLSFAQRNMAMVMNFLRCAPAPIYSPKFPLLPGTPPAPHLPLNPILYLVIAVDSVAPLRKIKSISGGGGGGRALELPEPLPVRARRRIAFLWILDVVEKKQSRGSGRKQLPHRIAEEIIAVVEGRSGVWERRRLVHKQGTAARANVGSRIRKRKGK